MIELLVVVLVVAILAAIIGFTISRAITSGKVRVSAENLRAIGVASNLYAADWNDYLPPYHSMNAIPGVSDFPVEQWKGALSKYGLHESQFYAPLDKFARKSEGTTDVPGGLNHLYSSYEHSGGLLQFLDSRGFLVMSLSQVPDRTIADHIMEMGNSFVKISGDERQHVVPYDGNMFQVLYLDGRVSPARRTY